MSGDINVQSFSGKVNISNNLLVGSSHLFVDTVNNRVGITTASPGASLEVNGNVHVGTDLTLGGILTGDGSGLANVNSDSGLWAGAGTGSVYLATSTDKVGIGTTGPGATLDIRGSTNDPSTPTVHIGDNVADQGDYGMVNLVRDATNGGTKAHLAFIRNGNTIFGQGYYNNTNTFGFWPSFGSVENLPAMSITTTGNVGIGVADPATTGLHVANSYNPSGGNTTHFDPQIYISGDTGTNGTQVSAIGFNGNSASVGHRRMVAGSMYYKGTTGNYGMDGYLGLAVADLSTGGADPYGLTEGELESHTRLAITNAGNVGIGTTSPGAPLAVVSTRNADTWAADKSQLDVLNDNGQGSTYGMSFAVSQTRGDGIIQTFNRNSGTPQYDLILQPNAGSVGIGTTSPDKLLHVETPVNTSENLVRIGSSMNNGSRSVSGIEFATNPQFHNGDNGQRAPAKIKAGFYDDGPLVANWADAYISLQTTHGNSGAIVDNLVCRGGNVGIGTTSPGRPLDVHFTGDTGIRAKNTGSTHASVYIDSASGYSYLRFQSGGAEKFWLQSTPTGDLAFRPSGSGHVMDIKNNGNVGIGATDPNHKLEVSGGILADYIAIPEINLHGARIGHVIEYRYSGMPSTAPTDESSMNSEFGQRHSSSITTNTQMRYPYASAATNIGRMWIGIIQATSTGVYTFGVNSDDASDLFVAGYRVADWYAGHGHNSSNINIPGGNQRTIYLKGGQWYKVKARFEENGGGEAFFALWKKPGDTSFSEIPSGNLAYILSDYSSAPTSDDRLKVNETMISNATETIIKLKPQIYDKFEFIEDVHDTKNKPTRESGLIAQDIWYDAPELRHVVYPYKTPNETREVNEDIQQDPDYSDWGPVAAQVNYFGLIPYLIKSFQELHEKVTSEKVTTQQIEEALQAEKEKTKTLESRLAFLETAVASLIS